MVGGEEGGKWERILISSIVGKWIGNQRRGGVWREKKRQEHFGKIVRKRP